MKLNAFIEKFEEAQRQDERREKFEKRLTELLDAMQKAERRDERRHKFEKRMIELLESGNKTREQAYQTLASMDLLMCGKIDAEGASSTAGPSRGGTASAGKAKQVEFEKEPIPDDQTMRRWGRKTVNFGKSQARGKLYSEAREAYPDHARWVLRTFEPDRDENFSDEFIDYAKYLRAMAAIDEKNLESESEDSEAASGSSTVMVPEGEQA